MIPATSIEQWAETWVGSEIVEEITLFRYSAPLTRPYHLSFGPLTHFRGCLVRARIGQSEYWGESTPLPGYGWETQEDVWLFLREACAGLPGLPAGRAFLEAAARGEGHPFALTALLTALEGRYFQEAGQGGGACQATVALSGETPAELAEDASRLCSLGYRTLKLKVGSGQIDDSQVAAGVLLRMPGDAVLRVDANQGLSLAQAEELWSTLNHPKVAYLEQPFDQKDWDTLHRFMEKHPEARVCLDESVWTEEHFNRALAIPGKVSVKLKLMKQTSAFQVARMAQRLLAEGRMVIFGNGVQGDVGAWCEGVLYGGLGMRAAGEFNGFAKQKQGLFRESPLLLAEGKISWSPWQGQWEAGEGWTGMVTEQLGFGR